jgi:tetratricopeptide (TPR) repeat protein
MIGATVSHYKIVEKLGEGGMGVVYLAEDLRLRRRVALKLLPRERTSSPEARARFMREAQTAASLNHPSICTIHEVDEADGLVFLAMEHIEGESLKDRIARGPVKIEEAVSTAMAIARGLGAAHSEGIVHRDIKPGNVMLTRDGSAKVLDFGLALAPEMTRLTREGRTTGTVSYMSPEQSRGDSVDHRTDIWSLGVVLYEMMTGQRPFVGDHEQAVLLSIVNDEPEAPSGLRTGVPLELERIVTKAMAKDPGDRYQHVDDMIVDLRGVARSSTSQMTVQTDAGAKSRSEQAARRRERRDLRAVAAAAVATLAVLVAVWAFTRGPWVVPETQRTREQDRVLVAAFANRSGDASLDYVGHSLVTAISEGLTATSVVEVVPHPHAGSGSVEEPERGSDGGTAVLLRSALETGASVLVTGSFHVRDDSLRIEARVLEVSDGDAINVISDEAGPLADPSVAMGKMRSRVMGSLVARASPVLSDDARSHAPTYEAYKEYEEAARDFGVRTALALQHLDRAIELDPGFVSARIFRIAALAALDRFAQADSLVQEIRSSSAVLSPSARLYLDAFESRLRGDHEKVLRKTREIVQVAPRHFMGRRMVATSALRLNRPREAIANLELLRAESPETDLYIESWTHGGLANAYHMLGDYSKELQILEEGIERFPDLLWMRGRKVRALAGLGRVDDIEDLIEEASASPASHGSVGSILLVAADELRAHGHPEKAHDFAERGVAWYRARPEREGATEASRRSLGFALYTAGHWDEARELFSELAREHPDYRDYRGYIGTLAARAGDVDRAETIRDSMLAADEPYDFGMNTYWAACISAQLGRKEEAMEYLRASYAEGAGLGLHVHQDRDLEPLWDYPPFQRFLEPRD